MTKVIMGRNSKVSEKQKVNEYIENQEGQKDKDKQQEDESTAPLSEEVENEPTNGEKKHCEKATLDKDKDGGGEEEEREGGGKPTNGEKKHCEEATLDKDNDGEEEEEEEGGGEEVNELWDVVRVIPTDEEKVECRNDGCTDQAVATWSSNIDPEDKWDLCEQCQLEEMGGWPDGVDPIKHSTTSNDDDKDDDDDDGGVGDGDTVKRIVANTDTIAFSNIDSAVDLSKDNTSTTSEEDKGGGNDGLPQNTTTEEAETEDEDESFDLSQIISLDRLLTSAPLCSGGDTVQCSLPACSVWISKQDPKKKWYYCIDCQERDFGGWPPAAEMPCSRLEPEHLRIITQKCSQKKNPAVPILTRCITPLPNSPQPPKGVASQVVCGKKKVPVKGTAVTASKNDGKKKKASAGAVACHEKWLGIAIKYGGSRVIIDKKVAKKAIFGTLFDAFKPVNFNDLYKLLKAEIPSPLLKNLLQDMTIGAMELEKDTFCVIDNDDDGDVNANVNVDKKGKLGSLIFKQGRTLNTGLYYVDHTQKPEMTAEERQLLSSKIAATNNEHGCLTTTLKLTTGQAKKLQSEPTNDQLDTLLSDLEEESSILTENVAQAQVLTVNEAHKTSLKRKIQKMGAAYAKRKRLCVAALSSLEEFSDGTLSAKKILSGDGPIYIDSDESVNKAAIAFTKDKRGKKGRNSMGSNSIGPKKKAKNMKYTKPLDSDENFVGVTLDGFGSIKRVYVDEE